MPASSAEAQIRITAKNETSAAFKKFESDAEKAAANTQKRFEMLSSSMKKAGIALTAFGAVGGALVAKATLLSARVQTLGVVLQQVGKTAGYSKEQLNAFEASVKKQGITTQVARMALTRMVQANLDLEHSTKLATIAQDAAVIAGINSSDAFNNMIYAINTLNPRVLKTMGLTISLEQAYAREAKTLGITTNELTMMQKKQIAMNEVMKAGVRITGTYDAAMDTAGKKLTSLPRHFEEAGLALGAVLLPHFADLIDLITSAIKGFNGLSKATKDFAGAMLATSSAMAMFVGPMLLIGTKIPMMVTGLQTAGSAFFSLGINIKALATGAGFLTTKLAMLGPGLGALAVAGVVAITFIALAAAMAMVVKTSSDIKAGNKGIKDALQEHARAVIETSDSYEDYVAELERVEAMTKHEEGALLKNIIVKEKTIITQKEFNLMLDEGAKKSDLYEDYIVQVSDAEYELQKAVLKASNAQRTQNAETERWTAMATDMQTEIERTAEMMEDIFAPAIEELNYLIGVNAGENIDSHNEKMGDLREAVYEAGIAVEDARAKYGDGPIPPGAAENIAGLEGVLDDARNALDEEAAAWERSTNQILFNMAARAMESLPIDQQAGALASLAQELNLIDAPTAALWESIGTLTGYLADGSLKADDYGAAVANAGAQIMALPPDTLAEVEIRITATGDLWAVGLTGGTVTTEGPPVEQEEAGGWTAPKGVKSQHGGPLGVFSGSWTLVGEAGQELVTPQGYVLDAKTTRAVIRAGFLPTKKQAIVEGPGDVYVPPPSPIDYSDTSDTLSLGAIAADPSLGGGGTTTTTAAAVAEVADAAADAVTSVTVETVQAIAASTAIIGVEIAQITAQQTEQMRMMLRSQENATREMTRILTDIKVVLEEQGTAFDFSRSVTEGMQFADFG